VREVLVEPEREEMQKMLRRAVARGEVSPGNPALDYVLHMMAGAFIARDLIDGRPPTRPSSRLTSTPSSSRPAGSRPKPADRG
jgi:hypothetical protein